MILQLYQKDYSKVCYVADKGFENALKRILIFFCSVLFTFYNTRISDTFTKTFLGLNAWLFQILLLKFQGIEQWFSFLHPFFFFCDLCVTNIGLKCKSGHHFLKDSMPVLNTRKHYYISWYLYCWYSTCNFFFFNFRMKIILLMWSKLASLKLRTEKVQSQHKN